MVLLLGRGEHCPRERQHQREMVKFYEWCAVACTRLVTVCRTTLMTPRRCGSRRAPTGPSSPMSTSRCNRSSTFVSTPTLITEPRCPRARSRTGAAHRQHLRGLLVLGPPVGVRPVGRPARSQPPHPSRLRPNGPCGARLVARLAALSPGRPCQRIVSAIAPRRVKVRRAEPG